MVLRVALFCTGYLTMFFISQSFMSWYDIHTISFSGVGAFLVVSFDSFAYF